MNITGTLPLVETSLVFFCHDLAYCVVYSISAAHFGYYFVGCALMLVITMVINVEIVKTYWKSFKSLESPDDTTYQQQASTCTDPVAIVQTGQAENPIYSHYYGDGNTTAIPITT